MGVCMPSAQKDVKSQIKWFLSKGADIHHITPTSYINDDVAYLIRGELLVSPKNMKLAEEVLEKFRKIRRTPLWKALNNA